MNEKNPAETSQSASGAKAPGDSTAITSYGAFQAYLTKILTNNISQNTGKSEESDSENSAPHGAFWNTLMYDQFVSGNVPGVTPAAPILVKGNSQQSNLILALQGVGPLFDPNTGQYGQMPADGPPFLTQDQIQPIADWIDAGCPE